MQGTAPHTAEAGPPPERGGEAQRLYAKDVAPLLGLSYRRTRELMQDGRIQSYRELATVGRRGGGRTPAGRQYTFWVHVQEYKELKRRIRGKRSPAAPEPPGGDPPPDVRRTPLGGAAPDPPGAAAARVEAALAAGRAPSAEEMAAVLAPTDPTKRAALVRICIRAKRDMAWYAGRGGADVAIDELVRFADRLAKSRARLEGLIPGLPAG